MSRRVLLTVHKFFPQHRAGTEVLTLKVAQELQRRGYEVLVVTANPPDLDARHPSQTETTSYEYEGVPVLVVEEKLRLTNYTFAHEYYHLEIKKFFDKVLLDFKPDLLHVFHAQNLSAAIIESARQRQLPVVCSATDFWFVCPIVQLKRPDGSVCRGPGPGAVKCLTCYTPKLFPPASEFEEALGKRYPLVSGLSRSSRLLKTITRETLFGVYKLSKLKGAVAATVERPGFLRDAANSMQAIMVPTRLMKDIFAENGIRDDLLHLVRFGIDTAPLKPFQTKSTSDVLRIGFIGTLFEHKGVDLLIDAFQKLPADAAAVLKIYGDVEQFPEYGHKLLTMAARELPNSTKIQFCGTFPNSELGPVLSEIDILAVPSRWYENTPLVIQSALATKTPLVATDLGGLSELIHHDQNGLLFELNNVNSLHEQLARLLADKGLARRLAANIAEERTVPEMVNDIESIYDKVARPACVVP